MRIWISRNDIDNGQQRSVRECPIAKRVKRLTDANVRITNDDAIIDGKIFALGKSAQKFVIKFDRNRFSVQPQHVTILGWKP